MFIPDTDYEAYQTRKRQERQQAATPAPEAPDFWNVPNTGPLVPSPNGMDGPALPPQLPMRPPIMPDISASGTMGGQTRLSPMTQPLPPPQPAPMRIPLQRPEIPDNPLGDVAGALTVGDGGPITRNDMRASLQGSMERSNDAGLNFYRGALEPISGLATELPKQPNLQGYYPPLEAPQSLEQFPDWWKGLGERQEARRAAGMPSLPVGDILPFTPAEYGALGRGVAGAIRAAPAELGASAKIANEIITMPQVKRLLPAASIEDVSKRVPAWQDPALTAQAEKVGAKPPASLPETAGSAGTPVPPGGRPRPTAEWAPGDKPLSNPKPLGPRADALAQLEDALTPTKLTPREAVSENTDKLLRAMYDKTWDAKTIEAATGVPVHKLAQIVPGSIAHGELLVEKQVMPVLRSVGKDVEFLEQYMVGMRFGDVLSRNPAAKLPGGVDGWVGKFEAIESLKQKIGPQRFAAVEAAAKQMWQLNDDLVLKPRLEAGLLNKEQYTQIKSGNPHYISFYREDFTGLQTGFAKGGGPANVTNAGIDAMDLGGSVRKLDKPLARFNAQVINTRHLIAENNAAKALVQGLLQMEKAGTAAKGAAKAPLSSGERFVKIVKEGEKIEDSNIWGSVSFLEEGQRVTAQVAAPFAKMAKGLEAESANFWSSLARAASFPLRAGAVTYNLAFIPKNVIRDLTSAFYREGLQPLSREYIEGWTAAIARNSDYEDAARAGVFMSGIVDNMRSTNALARAAHPGGITVASPKDALLLIPRVIRSTAKSIERVSMIAEQSTRKATYEKLRGQGLGELEAAVRSRDVSVDFAKSGNIMKVINQAIPFSNAGLQGAANTLRTMRYNPKQAIIGSSPLAALTVLAYVNNQRYETASMIPEREYAMNWIFQFGEGTKAADPKYPNKPAEKFPIYARIPKGSIGGLLTAPIEMALRYAWQNDDRSVLDDLGGTFFTMGTALSPVDPSLGSFIPPLASTYQGLESGYDSFRGQPIVPRGEQDRPPELQYGPETSREAVALGEKFHVSPRMIDWAIKDAAAGVGSQTLWLSDLILGAVGYDPVVYGEAKRQPFTGAQELAKMPITGGFLGTQNSEQNNRGWDAFDEAVMESQRAAAAVPELRRLGVTIGQVGDKAPVGEFSIVLTPQERAELQAITTQVLVGLVPHVTSNPDYKTAPLPLQVKAIQAVMDKGREAARKSYLGRLSESDLERRVIESLPVAVE